MAKSKVIFECGACGAKYLSWRGKCDACGEWNSISESRESAPPAGITNGDGGVSNEFFGLDGAEADYPRVSTGIREFDRALGGGIVDGGAVLVGGDPGIGKSTILLQSACNIASAGHKVFYLTGEESINQIRMRAGRLGLAGAPVQIAARSNVRDIAASVAGSGAKAVIIDSIQTMFIDSIDSVPGSISQARACANELIRLAKIHGFSLFLVGHVTKDGAIAGPRVLEHMVDCVLYFEGERGHQFRILRSVKNRFGATDEIGVFEMTQRGLCEVGNPSALFLAERKGNVSGSAVFAGVEGTRPLLLEIQALVSPSSGGGSARRSVVGWDPARLAMITAVLDARARQEFYSHDIFMNVAGGMKVMEPAADLAVAAALMSSKNNIPAPADTAIFGEVGLSGEVRSVPSMDLRIKEAAKLGFKRALAPKSAKIHKYSSIQVMQVGHILDLAAMFC